jgi:UrcA family protein
MKKVFLRPVAGVTFVAAGCALIASLALAQTQPMEVVTVEAARAEKVAQTQYGVPVREITIRSRVSYADLDLKTEKGVRALEKRIHETAKSTCKEMDVKFPAEGSGEEACIKEAVDGAMAQAKKIIAAKGGPAPK